MKLMSINIEGTIHLQERVLPFLKAEQPDVACLQEVFFKDIPLIEQELGAKGYFALQVNVETGNVFSQQTYGMLGQMILTKYPVRSVQHQYYSPPVLLDDLNEYLAPRLRDADFSPSSVEIPFEIPTLTHPNALWRVLTSLETEIDGEWYRVVTTHFTRSDHAQFTSKQADDFKRMWLLLEDLGEFVLCGDFNSPRGGAQDEDPNLGPNVFDTLSERLQDNIPPEVTSTIDPDLHRAPGLEIVVDGLFSTPTYQVESVSVVPGISDHQALVAEVSKFRY